MSNLKPLPAVPLDFLTKLGQSRAVMEKADTIAATKAAENGTGMKNVPLAPRGATPSLTEQAPARKKFDPLPDQDVEYLTQLPAGMMEQQVSMGGNAIRDVHAMPITEDIISKSAMPESVKKAMMAFPIDINPPVEPVSLSNVRMDLMELDKPVPQRQQLTEQIPVAQPRQQPAPAAQLDPNVVRQMVKEEMTNMFIKNIREEAIKDTIKTLMKEGIIPSKKK